MTPVTSYDRFVGVELGEAARRYREGHAGIRPSEADLAHLAWQRLIERRELTNWLEAAYWKDRRDVPWVSEDDAPSPAPNPAPTLPSRTQARKWRGNFLCFPGFEFAFLYPAWPRARQQDFRRVYRQAGYTHVPFAAWGSYPGHGTYDYSRDIDGLRRLLGELLAEGCIPCLFAITDPVGQAPTFTATQMAWLRETLPMVRDLVPALCLGWELPQVGEWWCGRRQLQLARLLRELADPDCLIYAHFPGDRITGWPDYGHTEHCPGDEMAWWREAGDALDGLLYQRPHDEPERDTLIHTLGGDTEDGHDVGDASRIAGGYWGINKDLVFFEHSRDPDRHRRLVARVVLDPRVAGYC